MKNRIIPIIAVAIIMNSLATSCTKDVNEDVNTMTVHTKKIENVPTFINYGEFNHELTYRLSLRNSGIDTLYGYEVLYSNYNSIGVISDKLYYGFISDTTKSERDFMDFVEVNEAYIQFVDEDTITYCLPRFYQTPLRYIANEEGLFALDSSVVKLFDNGTVTTSICNIDELRTMKECDIDLNDTVFLYTPYVSEDSLGIVIFNDFEKKAINHSNHLNASTYHNSKVNGIYRLKTEIYYSTLVQLFPFRKYHSAYFTAKTFKKGFLGLYFLEPSSMVIDARYRSCSFDESRYDEFRATESTSEYNRQLFTAVSNSLFTSRKKAAHFWAIHIGAQSDIVPDGAWIVKGDQSVL